MCQRSLKTYQHLRDSSFARPWIHIERTLEALRANQTTISMRVQTTNKKSFNKNVPTICLANNSTLLRKLTAVRNGSQMLA